MTTGCRSPGGTTKVNEAWVAQQLQADQNVTLAATHDITFKGTNAAADFTLLGGGGNLTVTAGESILFSNAKEYIIRTGGGQVALTANDGNIGAPGDRLSVVSGYGTDNGVMYEGVTQAGDVVLNAGKNIFLDNVTVKSVPDVNEDRHALFSANAGSSINIAGGVDVVASARGSGVHASALVNLHAHSIDIAGPVTVIANALNPSDGIAAVVANATFIADAALGDGDGDSSGGKLTLGNAIDVEAHANAVNAVSDVHASALASLVGMDINVTGNAKVIADASINGALVDPPSVTAKADLLVHAAPVFTSSEAASIIFDRLLLGEQFANSAVIDMHGGIDVEAHAGAIGSANEVLAVANVLLDAAHITVDGPVLVEARAYANDANNIVAVAHLNAQLGSATFSTHGTLSTAGNTHNFGFSGRVAGTVHVGANDVTFGNTITVTAVASGDANNATADAFTRLAGFSVDVKGDVTVSASALNAGGNANAQAKLLVDYADADITATANDAAGLRSWLNSHSFSGIGLGGNSFLGNFFSGHSDQAVQLKLRGHIGGSTVNLHNGLEVRANAIGNDGTKASAQASAILAGDSITVVGNALVSANAFGLGIDEVAAKARLVTDVIGVKGSIAFGTVNGIVADGTGTFNPADSNGYQFDAHFGGLFASGVSVLPGGSKFTNNITVAAHASGAIRHHGRSRRLGPFRDRGSRLVRLGRRPRHGHGH